MKRTLIAVALAAIFGVSHAETDLLLFGASKHFDTHGYHYNEVNPGLGVEWKQEEGPWLFGGFVFRDSLNQTGGSAYVGYRVSKEIGNGYHIDGTLRAGWLKDAKYNGVSAVPAIGIGKGRWTVEFTYIPKIGANKVPTVGIWLRYSF